MNNAKIIVLIVGMIHQCIKGNHIVIAWGTFSNFGKARVYHVGIGQSAATSLCT